MRGLTTLTRGAFCAFFLAISALLQAAAAPGFQEMTPQISIIKSKPMMVDAEYNDEKLSAMTGMVGFSASPTLGKERMAGLYMPVQSDFSIGTDGKNLRFIVRSAMGESGVLARANPGNAGTFAYLDDCYEFVVAPRPLDKNGDIYHFMLTHRGAFFSEAKKNNMPVAWSPIFQYKSIPRPELGVWDYEVILPLLQFDIAEWKEGEAIGFRVIRNWRRITLDHWGIQSAWGGRQPCNFASNDFIPLVRLDSNGPVIRFLQLCNSDRTRPDIKVSFFNPTQKELKIKNRFVSRPDNSHHLDSETSLTLAPGETKIVDFKIPQMAMDEACFNSLLCTSADDGRIFYRRAWKWTLGKKEFFQRAKTNIEDKLIFKYSFYPSTNTIFARLNLEELSAEEMKKFIGVTLTVCDKNGAVLKTEKAAPAKMLELLVQLPDLKQHTSTKNPSGDYQLKVELNGLNVSYNRTFQRKVFAWEGNSIGKSDRLIPPFTAIEVNGQTVSTILRTHEMSAAGLWKQVKAEGIPLFADNGMRLEAVIGGKTYVAEGKVIFTASKDTQVQYEAVWKAGELKGITRGAWEMDGVMTWNTTLKPCKGAVDALRIVIPLRPEEFTLMHVVTDQIRNNYGGAIPAGEGVVWKSTEAINREIQHGFVPYIWLGGETRGLSVFAENDRGWQPKEGVAPQQIIRKNGQLMLVMNLFAKPVTLTSERTIRLGFQATPVKPMPANWRRMVHWGCPHDKTVGPLVRKHLVYEMEFRGNSPSRGTGGKFGSSGLSPRDDDMALWQEMVRVKGKGSGAISNDFIEKWVSGYRGPEEDKPYYRRMTREGLVVVSSTKNPITWYTDVRGLILDNPEARTFLNDWTIQEFQETRDKVQPYQYNDYALAPVESYRDYAAHWHKIMLEMIAQNIFWDCPFFISTFNHGGTTDLYRTADGKWQPTMGLYDMRELVKRTAIQELEVERKPWNMVHMTNANIAPVLSYSQLSVDWEDNRGIKPYQERYTKEYIRAVTLARQLGNVPCGLCLVTTEVPGADACMHTAAGVALTHEIRYSGNKAMDFWKTLTYMYDFGYGYDTTTVHNYWDKDYPVALPKSASSIYVEKNNGNEALLIVCDYDDLKKYTAQLPRAIVKATRWTPADGEKDWQNFQSKSLTFTLDKYDYAVFRLIFK